MLLLGDELEDILCNEQRVRVQFHQSVLWSSHLLVDNDGQERNSTSMLQSRHSVLEVPLWLANCIFTCSVGVVLPLSQTFGVRLRADLAAGADQVCMRELALHWYRLGLSITSLLPTERIAELMISALSRRLPLICQLVFSAAIAHSSLTDSNNADPHQTIFGGCTDMHSQMMSNLDVIERRIVSSGIAARSDVTNWINRTGQLMKPIQLFEEYSFEY